MNGLIKNGIEMSDDDTDALLEESSVIDEHIHEKPGAADDYIVQQLHELPDGGTSSMTRGQA